MTMELLEIDHILSNYRNLSGRQVGSIETSLHSLKLQSLAAMDEAGAKWIWVLETILAIQTGYTHA